MLSFLRLNRQPTTSPFEEAAVALHEAEVRRKVEEQKRGILAFPEKVVSVTYLASLPKGEEFHAKFCPLGTWFVCSPFDPLPGVIVLGQVVCGDEAIVAQVGAAMSPPDRWINRYRAVIEG